MTERYDSENPRDDEEFESDRYAAVGDGAGDTIVYDTENSAAWLKSDAAVDVAEMA